MRFQHEVYPETTTQASRQVLTVGEIEIRDRLAHSHINKFLYQYCSEARPRQAHANMVLIKALHVRPNVQLPALECCLKVSVLPLRLHIDQDTLTFMSDFSAALSENGHNSEGSETDFFFFYILFKITKRFLFKWSFLSRVMKSKRVIEKYC